MNATAASVLVLALLLGAWQLAVAFAQVSRARLRRFAFRQRLAITAGNGPVVIAYLATTRRWRGGLLLAAIACGQLYLYAKTAANQEASVNSLTVFAGWFAGAVIAEWRVRALPSGARRVASLRRRGLRDYVPWALIVLPALAWAVVGGLTAAGLAWSIAHNDGWLAARMSWLAGGMGVFAGALWAVTRRVLHRAQPLSETSLLAADEALRGRSLRVLLGATLATAGYAGVAVVNTLDGHMLTWHSPLSLTPGFYGTILVPLLGWWLATAPARGRFAQWPGAGCPPGGAGPARSAAS